MVTSASVRCTRQPENQRFNVWYQVPAVKRGGGIVMILGYFSRNGEGPLFKIDRTVTSIKYDSIITDNMPL